MNYYFFYQNEFFTYQDQYKSITCDECTKADLYEKRSKGNKTAYIDRIKKLIIKELRHCEVRSNLAANEGNISSINSDCLANNRCPS
jgi:hypothetical protein